MNANSQMEVHYINTGFPYTVTESFMDFFEGLTHVPVHYDHTGTVHDQVQVPKFPILVRVRITAKVNFSERPSKISNNFAHAFVNSLVN